MGQQLAHVLDGPDAAADRERDEHLVGRPCHRVEQDLSCVRGGRDVEEHDLVGALAIVGGRELRRIPGVAQVDEADPLDHAAISHVEARDDALGGHQAARARKFAYRRSPSSPLFSGWNWVPMTLPRAAAAAGEWSVQPIEWLDASGVNECTK